MTDLVGQASTAAVSGLEVLTRRLSDHDDAASALQRMNRLIAAQLSVIEDLDLNTTLTRIVEAAVELVDARYGAIGVLAPDGSLEEFLQVGIAPEEVARIGHLPRGLGLLGAITQDVEPLRLADLHEDPRSVGFPEHHPQMRSFLGVSVRLRDEIFGNLYLCDPRNGDPFTDDDEALAMALASSAGVAIENARLYQVSRHRERWAEGSAKVVQQLIEPVGDPLDVVADQVRELADADLVSVLLPARGGTIGDEGSLADLAMRSGRPQLIDDIAEDPDSSRLCATTYGPEMAVPVGGSGAPHGVLVVARYRDRPRFTETDVDVAASFAVHATMALELDQARTDREQLLVLEDRERIARDLHDHVIQRLFASGLTLHSLTAGIGSEKVREGLAVQINEIDQISRQVRNTIFELQPPAATMGHLRTDVLRAVRAAAKLFHTPPQVRFSGPVDTLIPAGLHEDIVAVIREGLSNTARHAEASRVEVVVLAQPDRVRIEVSDDGVGIDPSAGRVRSGLQNLQTRAADAGGEMSVTRREPVGTVLSWSVPLVGARP